MIDSIVMVNAVVLSRLGLLVVVCATLAGIPDSDSFTVPLSWDGCTAGDSDERRAVSIINMLSEL